MKDFILFNVISIIYWSFKSTIMPSVPVPDISMLIVFFMAVRGVSVQGLIIAFTLGYIDDTFSGAVLGSSSFALIITYITIYLFCQRISLSTTTGKLMGGFFTVLIKGVFTLLALTLTDIEINYFGTYIPVAITTALFAPAILYLIKYLQGIHMPLSNKGLGR
jgi:rod shape-determining protein MreD